MKRLWLTLFLMAYSLIGITAIGYCQNNSPAAQPNSPNPITQKPPDTLTYHAFIERILNYHPDMQQASLEIGIAGANRLSKQGAFDPYVNGNSQTQRFNSSSVEGKAQLGSENEVTLNLPTSVGLTAIAGGKLALGDIKTPISPTGDGGEYYWGVKLPLLRGFLMNEKVAALKQAKIKELMASIKYRQSALKLLTKANITYWQWVASWQSIAVVDDLNDLAALRLNQIQQRVDLGDEAAIVATEAKREVAKRQGQQAQTNRTQQEKALALGLYLWQPAQQKGELVATQQTPMLLDARLLTPGLIGLSGNTPPAPPGADQQERDTVTALQQRPTPQLIGLAQTLAAVDKALATNNLLPQLDVSAIHGMETGNNSIGPVFKAGIQMNIPLRYRKPLGDRRQARLSMDQLAIEAQQITQQIRIEVQDVASEWAARHQQYLAAKLEYETAKKLAEGERIRFRLGDTTLFLVNQRERSAADAELKLIEHKNSVYEIEKHYQLTLGNV